MEEWSPSMAPGPGRARQKGDISQLLFTEYKLMMKGFCLRPCLSCLPLTPSVAVRANQKNIKGWDLRSNKDRSEHQIKYFLSVTSFDEYFLISSSIVSTTGLPRPRGGETSWFNLRTLRKSTQSENYCQVGGGSSPVRHGGWWSFCVCSGPSLWSLVSLHCTHSGFTLTLSS